MTSVCRHCRYYAPEGRRGGQCGQLGAPVQASWKSCSLALPPFAPSWETLESMLVWDEQTPALNHLVSLEHALNKPAVEPAELPVSSITESMGTKISAETLSFSGNAKNVRAS